MNKYIIGFFSYLICSYAGVFAWCGSMYGSKGWEIEGSKPYWQFVKEGMITASYWIWFGVLIGICVSIYHEKFENNE